MAQITSKDKIILQWFCSKGEVSEELAEQVGLRRSALYERVGRLVRNGLLQRLGRNQYKLTPAGQKVLLGQNEGLAQLYPLLVEVPTAQHLAIIELIIAAISARISGLFDEFLPSFLLIGPTMAWKTSLGRFVCYMLGLDPARHVIDLSTETSKSLWLRRDARGRVIYKREILDAPFVTFDEYGLADKQVRAAVWHFIGGRLKVPVENEVLESRVTALLTMNPLKEEGNLSDRTGLLPAKIRRLVVCDLCWVDLPDLAVTGEDVVERAARATPLQLRQANSTFTHLRRPISSLMRQLLLPEALQSVNFEMLRALVAGMAAYMSEEKALQRVVRDYCVTLETLGWTVENWRAKLAQFADIENEQQLSGTTILEGEIMGSDIQKYLAYLQVETGKDAVEALRVLVEVWQAMRRCGLELDDLKRLGDVLSHAAAQRLSAERLEHYLGFERITATCDITPEQVAELATVLKRSGYLDKQRLEVLMGVAELLGRYDLDIGDLRQALSVLITLRRQGVPPSIVHALKDVAVQFYRSDIDVEEAMEDLAQAVIDDAVLRNEIDALMQKRDRLLMEVKKLSNEAQDKQEKLLEWDGTVKRLMEELINMCEQVKACLHMHRGQFPPPGIPLPPQM